VFVERMQSSPLGESHSRDYLLGAQIIHDPVGNVVAGYSSEFSNIWDSGSNEMYWDKIEHDAVIRELKWAELKKEAKSTVDVEAKPRSKAQAQVRRRAKK
jgi:hypothetical protein